MPTLPLLDIKVNANYSPHVVILGAGASIAACPRGDRNGRKLPVMANIVNVLGLGSILEETSDHFDANADFELIYDELASSPKHDVVRDKIDQAVRDYFSALKLPDCVTLYDQLLLSLRSKDIIASFNWDPLLLQAYARNRTMGNLPRVVFLHGNVYLGYCPEHSTKGYSTQNCNMCGKLFKPSSLLFPIKSKDYRAHQLLASEWDELSKFLEHAYMLTIFGYAAPTSDAAAREIMLKAWGSNSTRELSQIEIVDVLPQRTINRRWSEFIEDLHGGAVRRFSHTWQFNYPRRSCEALAFATLQQNPWATRAIPRFRRLDRLQEWIKPLIEEELALEQKQTPLQPFRKFGYKEMKYRSEAKQALERANLELQEGIDHRLRYAALELRIGLECLAYERANLYRDELPSSKLKTWQPRQLIDYLLEIDPYADQTCTLRYGREDTLGEKTKAMTSLGTEEVMSLRDIKKYYGRLGSYLHAPTSTQVSEGKVPQPTNVRNRCEEVAAIIERVLLSPIFNINLRSSARLECHRCGVAIVRRIPPGEEAMRATCIKCGASYDVTRVSDTQVEWKPRMKTVLCKNTGCHESMDLWEDELVAGTRWKCLGCQRINEIALGVMLHPPAEEDGGGSPSCNHT